MLKILVLVGIPASGKSTFARQFTTDKSKEWVIVNRDSIREMLGDYWVPSREKLVTDIERASIYSAINRGFNVIVDATNIGTKSTYRFEAYSGELSCDLEFKNFEVDLETAIERDNNRNRTVGEEVVRSFYNKIQKI